MYKSMKRKWIAALLAGCMLAALLLTGCSAAETVKRLRFGVAGEGGVYHNFGEQFAALENETSNGTIELRTTAGSAANLRLLTGEYLQLAIAQADLAQDACNQTGIFAEEEDIRGFGAVAALYTESCQVIVRADSDIQSIEDLQGKTVSIGAEESGSEQNALQILSAYGLNDRLVDTINLNYTDAADQLKAGKIDAIVITVGIPSPVVTELAGECGIRLLNVDGTAAQRLLSSYNAYREVTIPAGTYPGQDADVQTVGVKAVLLASDSLPAKQVQQLTELLFSSREALEEQLPGLLDAISAKYPDLISEAPRYLGVQSLDSSSVVLRFTAAVSEENIYAAQRKLNRELLLGLRRLGVECPFPQLDVHSK